MMPRTGETGVKPPDAPSEPEFEGDRSEEANEKYGDNREARVSASGSSIVFLNGNSNTPALLIGDDPSNGLEGYEDQDNVLVVPLGTAQSFPRNTVADTEGTPGTDEDEDNDRRN